MIALILVAQERAVHALITTQQEESIFNEKCWPVKKKKPGI